MKKDILISFCTDTVVEIDQDVGLVRSDLTISKRTVVISPGITLQEATQLAEYRCHCWRHTANSISGVNVYILKSTCLATKHLRQSTRNPSFLKADLFF